MHSDLKMHREFLKFCFLSKFTTIENISAVLFKVILAVCAKTGNLTCFLKKDWFEIIIGIF